jgi:hypothetical protein
VKADVEAVVREDVVRAEIVRKRAIAVELDVTKKWIEIVDRDSQEKILARNKKKCYSV